jgi:transketolase
MRKAMMSAINHHAIADPDVVFLTGDLGFAVVEPLVEVLGTRFVNVGVAEQNMISLASGLAATGFLPYCYSIAPFVTARCYEQIRNDIAYEGRQAILIGAGAGLSYGSLGPSHHSLEDATILATLPGMAVLSPANAEELSMAHAALVRSEQAGYIRVSREAGQDFAVPAFSRLEQGAHRVRRGSDVTLVASGPAVTAALDGILARSPILSVFEGYTGNPLELGLRRLLMARSSSLPAFAEVSVPLRFPKRVGSTEALRQDFGIDAATIAKRAELLLRAE